MFIFCLSSKSFMSESWVALVRGDNTILLEGPVSLLPSFQLLNRCWCGGQKISFPDPEALFCCTFLCAGAAQEGGLSPKACRHLCLAFTLVWTYVLLKSWISASSPCAWLSTRWQWPGECSFLPAGFGWRHEHHWGKIGLGERCKTMWVCRKGKTETGTVWGVQALSS